MRVLGSLRTKFPVIQVSEVKSAYDSMLHSQEGALEGHGSCFSHPERDCNMDIGDIGIDGHAHDSSMKVKSLKISLSKAKQPNAGYK